MINNLPSAKETTYQPGRTYGVEHRLFRHHVVVIDRPHVQGLTACLHDRSEVEQRNVYPRQWNDIL